MSEIDYDELLRSPLDDRGPRSPLPPALAVAVGSALGVFGVLFIFVGGGDGQSTAAPVTTTAAAAVVEVANPFPPGYTEIGGDLAVRALSPVTDGERVLVPLALAVRRGQPPDAVSRPIGGIWEAGSAGGSVRSVGVVADPGLPGTLSVVFPPGTEVGAEMRLVELWETRTVRVATEMEFPGVPFSISEPIVHDLGRGVTLSIDRLDLLNLLAEAEWSVSGTELAIVELGIDLLRDDGSVLDGYAGGLASTQPSAAGLLRFIWPPGIRVDQNEASVIRIGALARLATPTETAVAIPVPR